MRCSHLYTTNFTIIITRDTNAGLCIKSASVQGAIAFKPSQLNRLDWCSSMRGVFNLALRSRCHRQEWDSWLNTKESSLELAEKIGLLFSPVHYCMLLTNTEQFIIKENKQTSLWYNSCQRASFQDRNNLPNKLHYFVVPGFKKGALSSKKKWIAQ